MNDASASSRARPTPLISVIVPCFDATATLPTLLESLYDQANPPICEIILVDNRSHDDVNGLANWFRQHRHADHVVELRVVPALEHQGTSYAINAGAASARAERLVIIGADDAASVRWLVDAMTLFGQADVFSGSAIAVAGEDFERPLGEVRGLIEDPQAPTMLTRPQRSSAFPILMGGDLGITRELFIRLGGFDQSLPIAGEDNELALRLRQHGIEIATSPAFRIAYRQRTDPRHIMSETRRAVLAHVLLGVRYGILNRSPILGGTRLPRLAARGVRNTLRMMRVPRDGTFPRLVASDWRLLWSSCEGLFRYRIFATPPPPLLGTGLEDFHQRKQKGEMWRPELATHSVSGHRAREVNKSE